MQGIRRNQSKESQEDLINWFAEVWYADKLSQEMINKSFKAFGVTLNTNDRENEVLIGNNGLLGDYQEMAGQVEQQAISNNQFE